jgi:hypothetical protein
MRIMASAPVIVTVQLGALAILPMTAGVAVGPATMSAGSATGAAGSWSTAAAAPGVAAFYNDTYHWTITPTSISCGSPGNCAVVGYYEDTLKQAPQPFLLSQVNGVWAKARKVPGLTALAPHGAALSAVSCASAGNCSAGGRIRGHRGNGRAFVVSEVKGTWKRAMVVPGAAALAGGLESGIETISCASAGNCTAGGVYTQGLNRYQVFVTSQVRGMWTRALRIPGTAVLNKGLNAAVTSLSCGSPGNCTAIGNYEQKRNRNFVIYNSVFAARQINGKWRTARRVPSVNDSGYSVLASASCDTRGNCGAGGSYELGRAGNGGPDGSNSQAPHAFVATSARGTWVRATRVPGTATLEKTHGSSAVSALSCPSVRTCGVGGTYYTTSGPRGLFVASLAAGRWVPATAIGGIPALGKSARLDLTAMSCASPGNCSAGGYYATLNAAGVTFVVGEASGKWGPAIRIPGTSAADPVVISCAAAARCSAAGTFEAGGHPSIFVTSSKKR